MRRDLTWVLLPAAFLPDFFSGFCSAYGTGITVRLAILVSHEPASHFHLAILMPFIMSFFYEIDPSPVVSISGIISLVLYHLSYLEVLITEGCLSPGHYGFVEDLFWDCVFLGHRTQDQPWQVF